MVHLNIEIHKIPRLHTWNPQAKYWNSR